MSRPAPDHPRACGENDIYLRGSTRFRGSPPRMRGKHDAGIFGGKGSRITPAHAGKTWPKKSPTRWWPDHPRACGENIRILPDGSVPFGSPPRMRGKPSYFCETLMKSRITPAHAGKTTTL